MKGMHFGSASFASLDEGHVSQFMRFHQHAAVEAQSLGWS
jgi:hypothetical protein